MLATPAGSRLSCQWLARLETSIRTTIATTAQKPME